VPYVPPDTIKKVAATSGHRVRRTDFFRWGTITAGWNVWRGALAVANFYVFLPWGESLSATPSLETRSGPPGK
jgi:hypothetical protein